MKFGKQLVRNRLKEWENEYVDYHSLNRALKELIGKEESEELPAAWDAELWREVVKVNRHYENTVASLEKRVESLHETWDEVCGLTTPSALQQQRYLVASLANILGMLEHVGDYSSLNFTAFFKILKKYDKKGHGAKRMPFLGEIEKQPFRDLRRLEALGTRVEALNELMGGEANSCYHAIERRQVRSNDKLCFWLGFTCMGLINTAVMWAMPETSDIYSTRKFMGIVPIFRFCFMLILLLWLTGWVTMVLEHHKVNYVFLLNIDPHIPIGSKSCLSLASSMTGVWLVVFWAFLADFKFNVFTHEGPYLNALIYPVLLVVAMAFLFCHSTHSRPAKLKLQLLACFMSVFCAPWVPVTFASNLAGDVLTSFTRPLMDFMYSMCYFSKVFRLFALARVHNRHPHRQMLKDGHQLNEMADTCHEVDTLFVFALVLSLPYIFRLLQCLRRARDDPNPWLHIANAAKYLCSIVVTFLSVVDPNSWVWFLVYAAATVYACVWDVTMDWGLFRETCRPQRARQLLPQKMYTAFFLLNLVGRSAWAFACLVPKDSMHFGNVSQECIVFVLSAFELYRRAQWAIIRIEHEHLTNASRYRSLCWVPPFSVATEASLAESASQPCPTPLPLHGGRQEHAPLPLPGAPQAQVARVPSTPDMCESHDKALQLGADWRGRRTDSGGARLTSPLLSTEDTDV